jgi:CHAT domain-containing protein/tetratricopeptide (TPR) repeat protein
MVRQVVLTLVLSSAALTHPQNAQAVLSATTGVESRPLRAVDDSLRAEIRVLLVEGKRLRLQQTAASFDSAAVLLDSARVLAEARFGHADSAVAAALFGLGNCYSWRGEAARRDSALQEALTIWRQVLGDRHPSVALAMSGLAYTLPPQGKYVQAEDQFQRAIAILKDWPEPHYEDLANAQHGLGWVYLDLNRFPEADSLFRDALESWRRSGCECCWGAGAEYLELGITARDVGRYPEAEKNLRLALDIFETASGPDHRLTGIARSEIGLLLEAQQRYREARPFFERAVQTTEIAFGTSTSQLIQPLIRLAHLDFVMGEFADAEGQYERALAISQNSGVTPDQPLQMGIVAGLADIEYALGHLEKSVNDYALAVASTREFLREIFPSAPEDLKLWLARQEKPISDPLLTLAVSGRCAQAVRPAFEMLLKGKALVLDALAAQRSAAYCSNDVSLVELEDHHAGICEQIARATHLASREVASMPLADSLKLLYHVKDSLEVLLGERCAAFRDAKTESEFSIEDIARALGEGTSLCEFITYHPTAFPQPANAQPTGPHYAAFALSGRGELRAVDLGPAAPIDSLVRDCRDQIESVALSQSSAPESVAEDELGEITAELYDRLLSPLSECIDNSNRIIISPDGELDLLPFESLRMRAGRYVVEQYEISYAATGRDILEFQSHRTPQGNYALVVADPDFDVSSPVTYASAPPHALEPSKNPLSRLAVRGQCLDQPFLRLAATREEGGEIAAFLKQTMRMNVEFITGPDATASRLREMPKAPRVLHVATHGFFCPRSDASDTSELALNPLLYSGLVLAGVNRRLGLSSPAGDTTDLNPDDGVLTAFEVSGMDLVGNELTVLSACETGSGTVMTGEGVFGLRRALQHAGAQSQIVSIYSVPDKTTRLLMAKFYGYWASGLTKAAALRQAQLDLLQERRRSVGAAHPLYWGGFVLIGNPH